MGTPVAALYVFSKEEIRQRFLRDWKLRSPDTDVREGSQAWVLACAIADSVSPMYQNAVQIARSVSRVTATWDALDEWAARMGTTRRAPVGSSGFVRVTTAPGGTNIQAGDVLAASSLQFVASVSGHYVSNDLLAVQSVDTGVATNLDVDTVLTWQVPRPGCAPIAKVVAGPDGEGLVGGRGAETDEELSLRLDYLAANPPASGNDAEYQDEAQKAPNVSVEKAFTYPNVLGPASTSLVFTIRQSGPGEPRVPTSAHIAAIRGFVEGQMPATDNATFAALVEHPVALKLRAAWSRAVLGWQDSSPWPKSSYGAVVSSVVSATSFTISATTAPVPGVSVGLYDSENQTWRRKRIKSVLSAGLLHSVTVDVEYNASDAQYVPVVGDVVSPWSESLQDLVEPVLTTFDGLGPGEMDAVVRRSPSSDVWPYTLTHHVLNAVMDVESLTDVVVLSPTLPYATPVGVPGVYANLIVLGDLGVYAE